MRIHFFAPSIILISFATLSLPGCFTVGDDDAPNDDDDSCNSDADCLNGFSCQNDRCVANSGGNGGNGGSTGGSGGKGGSSGGSGGKGGSTGGDGGTDGGSSGKGGSSATGGTGGDGGVGGSEAGTGGVEGGTGGVGGSTGGVGGSTGGSSGTGETTPAKFCNALSNNDAAVELTLEIGDVSLTALTGACAPDNECLGVPVGIDVPVALSDSSGVVSSGTYPEVPAGEEMVFLSAIDSSGEMPLPTIVGFPGNGICSAPDSYVGTVARFCNKLTSGGMPIVLTLQLGEATVSANTGECTPVDMCLPVDAGTDVSIALLDGAEIVTSGTFPSVPAGSSMLFQAEIDAVAGGPTITGGPYTGICGAAGAVDARHIEPNSAPKSANREFVTASLAFEQVRADSLILDAAVLGAAAGPRHFLAR